MSVSDGLLIVLSAPSGAGKLSLLTRLRAADDRVTTATSVTTRAPRPGEVDGDHYHFVDMRRFNELLAADEFVEWAEVHGNRYGTLRSELERCLTAGKDVILELDVQGMRHLLRQGQDIVSIFLMPPSLEELESRLRKRGANDENDIRVRLQNAADEMAARGEYDYTIINDELDRAADELKSILDNERRRLQDS